MEKRSRFLFIASFLAPSVLLYSLFVIWPLIQSFQMSAYRWRGLSTNRVFVGPDNFSKLASDDVFKQALINNLWLMLVGGLAIIVIAVAVAHGMQRSTAFTRFLRGVYLFPQAVSLVVVAILWMFLYNPSYGVIPSAMNALHISPPEEGFLGSSSLALPAVGVAFVWYAVGFYVMLFSAGLNQIPTEVSEAAELDGAKGIAKFFKVTWPLLWSIKKIAYMYIVINVMNIFAIVLLMTRGGPDRKTETMLTYLYEQAFTNRQFGYATSMAIANLIIALGLALLLMFLFRKNPEQGEAA